MPSRKTMNVSLRPELERYVAERVASGRYRSASEVIRAALRLLEKDEKEGLRHKSRTGRQKTGDDDAE
jgi:putative addiction module CopG family antidote